MPFSKSQLAIDAGNILRYVVQRPGEEDRRDEDHSCDRTCGSGRFLATEAPRIAHSRTVLISEQPASHQPGELLERFDFARCKTACPAVHVVGGGNVVSAVADV
jgi:hypothetical protein